MTLWVLEQVDHARFPYRLTIRRGTRTLLALRVRDRWPGASGNVFCMREIGDDWPAPGQELERVGVMSIRRFGKRVSIVLDRPTRRRCELLFLKRPYRHQEGEYEQIFWQTQQGLRQRRPHARFVAARGRPSLHVAIDPGERYAWQFPGSHTERVTLPVGDYALMKDGVPVAVVERKTFANLLRDLSDLRALHHTLAELATYPSAAMVIEAAYADFLNPDKVRPLNVRYTSRALAELAALHRGVQLIFAGNRKLAVEWATAFFLAVDAQGEDHPLLAVRETLTLYGEPPPPTAGIEFRLLRAIREELPEEFSIADLRRSFPDATDDTLRRVLNRLRAQGRLQCRGRGRAARWLVAWKV